MRAALGPKAVAIPVASTPQANLSKYGGHDIYSVSARRAAVKIVERRALDYVAVRFNRYPHRGVPRLVAARQGGRQRVACGCEIGKPDRRIEGE